MVHSIDTKSYSEYNIWQIGLDFRVILKLESTVFVSNPARQQMNDLSQKMASLKKVRVLVADLVTTSL